jgi:hypothetical protein
MDDRAAMKFKDERMDKKIVDLMAYRIEKTLKENGFSLKQDSSSRVTILMKLNPESTE